MSRPSSLQWHRERAASVDFIVKPTNRAIVSVSMVGSFLEKFPDYCQTFFHRPLTAQEQLRVLDSFLSFLRMELIDMENEEYDEHSSPGGITRPEFNRIYLRSRGTLPYSHYSDYSEEDSDSE